MTMTLEMPARLPTGIQGLDAVLGGGLIPNRLYVVEGAPGSGKTTLALQFLLAGQARGERGLYVTLSETAEELHAVAASHGFDLKGGRITLFELASADAALSPEREITLLHPWELELGETVKLITDEVERSGAVRVAFDSLSEMRLLAQDPLRYRRQILALKQFFTGRSITVLLLDDLVASGGERDLQLHSLAHGVITLERLALDYGSVRRRLEVAKMRGSPYREGWHDYEIRTGGLEIFPRLIASEHHRPFAGDPVPSGHAALDALLDGGPMRGTSTLITGPPGTGKSTLATQYVCAAAARGERSVIYAFDERLDTLLTRSRKLGFNLDQHLRDGLVAVRQIDPAELSPGEFTAMVRKEVEGAGNPAGLIVIDSLNGYLSAMPEEKSLVLQMRELLSYLNQLGVTSFLLNPQQGLLGSIQSSLNISYIADAVLLLRFFEAGGRMRKAISALKNRGGGHEDTIREFRIDQRGIRIGGPLTAFQGVLTGTPSYTGVGEPLLEARDESTERGADSA
jgi:circadian clock protein KaiC